MFRLGISRLQRLHYKSSHSIHSLVIAEHDGLAISPSTLSTIFCATKLGGDVTMLLLGHNLGAVIEQSKKIAAVSQVLCVADKAFANPVAEDVAHTVLSVTRLAAAPYTHILAPSSTHGKSFLPRAAALCDASVLTDVSEVVDAATFRRPMYAGNVLATLTVTDPVKFILVRGTAFPKVPVCSSSEPKVTVLELSTSDKVANLSRFQSDNKSESSRPDITSARVVVAGGRGVKTADQFRLLSELADALGGAVGASRAAVDAGLAPNDLQVGQTGKVVAPDLYIAVGISGAIQHVSGMRDSRTIVAINKDREAPIFQLADFGLVGDQCELVPQLLAKLRQSH